MTAPDGAGSAGPVSMPQQEPSVASSGDSLFSRVVSSFQTAMKLRVRLVPMEEREGLPAGDHAHPYCQMIQKGTTGRQRCGNDIRRAIHVSSQIGEPYIYQCHAGMISFAAAILNGGEKGCAFVCGPLLLRHPDAFFQKDLDGRVKDLAVPTRRLHRAASAVPVFSERRLQAAADLLFMIANYFGNTDPSRQRQQHAIARQQALLAEGLFQKKKESEHAGPRFPGIPPRKDLYRERELVDLIKFGDRKKAKVLLDDLLGTALFRSHEYIGVLKAHVLEIIVILARAAVEAGANLEEILGFKYRFIQNLSKDDSRENLYYVLMQAFDQIFDSIYQNRNIRHTRMFTKVKEYIWNNYSQDISLGRVAEAIGVSPYYLSHLFRKEMGLSFLEYLTSVRISVAKNLLMEPFASVLNVCLEVGYQDPSHFAKIFGQKEGISPSEFRKRFVNVDSPPS